MSVLTMAFSRSSGFKKDVGRGGQQMQVLGAGDVHQKPQDGGHVDPVGDLVSGKDLLRAHLIQAEEAHKQTGQGKNAR